MRVFWKMTAIELKLFLREPTAAFFTLIFPLILLVIFGGIFGNEPVSRFGNRGTVDLSVPGYIGMIIATSGLLSLPVTLSAYREKGILRRYQASPVSVPLILGSQVAINLLMLVIGATGLFVVGRLGYNLVIPAQTLNLFCGFLFSAASFLSLGFVLAGILPSPKAANAVGMALFFPMLFLSGSAMPIEILPKGMRAFAEFLPLTHVVELLKGIWFGQGWDLKSASILAAMLIVCAIASTKTFRWQSS